MFGRRILMPQGPLTSGWTETGGPRRVGYKPFHGENILFTSTRQGGWKKVRGNSISAGMTHIRTGRPRGGRARAVVRGGGAAVAVLGLLVTACQSPAGRPRTPASPPAMV